MNNHHIKNSVTYLLILGWLCSLLITDTSSAGSRYLTLTFGQQKTVSSPNITRVSVGNPAVADVKPLADSQQVLVTAVGVGETNIIIWDKDNHQKTILVQVVKGDVNKAGVQIKKLLKGIEGVKIRVIGNRIIIEGNLLREADLTKISKISDLYPNVVNLATLSPAVLKTITEYLNTKFQSTGFTNVNAQRLGNQIVIDGEVPNEAEKKKVELIASTFNADIKNLVKVGLALERMVLLHVDFIEVDKTARLEAGIKWGDHLGADMGTKLEVSYGGGIPEETRDKTIGLHKLELNYNSAIKLLKENAGARILSQPKIVCRSGEKAEFVAGGEVPIPIEDNDSIKVIFKEFGMIVNISPVVDSKNNIAAEILVENSTIDGYVDNYPTFSTSRVKTAINVKSGETIVLSGLVEEGNAKNVDKVPLLGDIPILGELFKSRSFKDGNNELVIFVKPEVVMPDDPTNKAMIRSTQEEYKKKGSELKKVDIFD